LLSSSLLISLKRKLPTNSKHFNINDDDDVFFCVFVFDDDIRARKDVAIILSFKGEDDVVDSTYTWIPTTQQPNMN